MFQTDEEEMKRNSKEILDATEGFYVHSCSNNC